ncbi:MAG: aminoacyl-tRNA hydrolase [Deltaproteobacteria bacterium]|nr:aminoacyl-tRNA hydrolase [Deltaproteobacteria bacterium]
MGLGNPGERYRNTRHNAGFMAVALLAQKQGFGDPVRFGESLVSKGRIEDQRVALAWPQTFMNLSGRAAKALLRFYKIPATDLLAVYDDMDLPLGRLKAGQGGGVGGHNGLASLVEEIGGGFHRLRVGIGRPDRSSPFQADYASYVLAPFTSLEAEAIDEALEAAAKSAFMWSFKGLGACQRQTNQRNNLKKKKTRPESEESGPAAGPVPEAAESAEPVLAAGSGPAGELGTAAGEDGSAGEAAPDQAPDLAAEPAD